MNYFSSRRARIWAAAAIFVGLLATLPLSVAFSLFGLKEMGVTAKSLRGPVWYGGAEELTVAGVRLGTMSVFLNPVRVILGQAQIQLMRYHNKPDDLRGAIIVGAGANGLEGVTGAIPLGAKLAPLPVSRAEFEQFSVRFSDGHCSEAQGRVRVRVAALISGLNLANGLSGDARCEGEALLLPLVSQSGQERLELRIRGNGSYEATMHVHATDPALAGTLVANGFQLSAGDASLRIAGAL